MNDGSLDTAIDWIPGMKNTRLKDLPIASWEHNQLDDKMFWFLRFRSTELPQIIFHAFHELEREMLEAISANFLNICFICSADIFLKALLKLTNTNLWKEDKTCLQWLDKRTPQFRCVHKLWKRHQNDRRKSQRICMGACNCKEQALFFVDS